MIDSASILTELESFFIKNGLHKTYWVGYSGGLDSHVLVFICQQLSLRLNLKLKILHINHQFNPDAAHWVKHCRGVCLALGLEFFSAAVRVIKNPGDSWEAVAREARYTAFADHMQVNDILLTAHHQDDQAETVLLQLLRGAGPRGLSAMPTIKPFAQGYHARPLLAFSRSALSAYAKHHRLRWIEDGSNTDRKMARNFLRHDILPQLNARWQSVNAVLAHTASHCAEAQSALDDYARQLYSHSQGSHAGTLAVSKVLLLAPATQKLLLRYWLVQQGYSLPSHRKMAVLIDQVLTAAPDKLPVLKWRGNELRRYQDNLYLMTQLSAAQICVPCEWNLATSTEFATPRGTLSFTFSTGHGLCASPLPRLMIDFRRGGEKVMMPGRGTHSLKQLFQEWRVLPWMRDRIPLVYLEQKLIGVVGYYLSPLYSVQPNEVGIQISFDLNRQTRQPELSV